MNTALTETVNTNTDWGSDVDRLGQFEAFRVRIHGVKRSGGSFTGLCPAHDDKNPSLSFSRGVKRKIVATCHADAGCSFQDIREALFPGWKDRGGDMVLETEETIYRYLDETGEELFEVVRGSGKTFWQRHWDETTRRWIGDVKGVRRVPYRLPELLDVVANDKTVFVVEGEKDADRLTREGLAATTNPSGAGKWRDEYSEFLKNARVVIVPDNDEAGRAHADKVLDSVDRVARSAAILKLPDLPDKGDVSDWLDAGQTVAELVKLANAVSDQEPKGLRVYTLRQLRELPPTEYTIDGLVQKGGLNLLVGASGTGKTFAALDMALSIATDTPWHGHTVQPGTALYIAAEGMTGMHGRVDAWAQTHDEPDIDRIGFVGEPLNMLNVKDVDLIIQAITRKRADVVVIDPLARFMEGADENSSKDMTAALAGLGRIQTETRATLIVPHHTGKKPENGARGHSSLLAAVDHEITMRNTGTSIEIRVTKARDLAGGEYVRLYLQPTAGSAVLQTTGPAHNQTGPSLDERRALQTLADIEAGATSSDWEKATDLSHARFQRARRALTEEQGLVTGGGGKGAVYQVTSEGLEALGHSDPSEP